MSVQAEIVKLARLLGSEPDALEYLAKVQERDLRKLREQATDRLYDADRAQLERAAA